MEQMSNDLSSALSELLPRLRVAYHLIDEFTTGTLELWIQAISIKIPEILFHEEQWLQSELMILDDIMIIIYSNSVYQNWKKNI